MLVLRLQSYLSTANEPPEKLTKLHVLEYLRLCPQLSTVSVLYISMSLAATDQSNERLLSLVKTTMIL